MFPPLFPDDTDDEIKFVDFVLLLCNLMKLEKNKNSIFLYVH